MTKTISTNGRKSWIAGLLCVILGSVIFIWWGVALEQRASSRMVDFRTMYYNVRALLSHQDPYNAINGELIAMDEGDKPRVYPIGLPSEITCVYPPSALLMNAPLGFLHWGPARAVWMVLNGGGLILAALLMWNVASEHAPLISGVLIGFFLANSVGLLFQGNVAGIVVSLCMIAAWCFFRNKFVLVGVLCLATSLAIKPHDSGLVWLYFVLAGAEYRKRALQALLVTAVMGLGGMLWVAQVSPDWTRELRSNLAAVSAHGAANDPGPKSGSATMVNSDINIQTVLAVIWDEPRFYNFASYLLCGILLLCMAIVTSQFPVTPSRFWIALAFVSALSMLPVYHRHHDAKLLMLAIPGCALVWARRRPSGILGLLVTSLAIAFNADIPRVILAHFESTISLSDSAISGRVMTILLARPAPLAILAMAVFYLWVYWRMNFEASGLDITVPVSCEMPVRVHS